VQRSIECRKDAIGVGAASPASQTMKRFTGALIVGLLSMCARMACAGATVGPSGETATASSALTLSDVEVAKLQQLKSTAALLWHTSDDFVNAVSAGATDEFKRLGIVVVAQTDAGFDAAKQKSDVETVLAKRPDVILALALDPVTAAEAFRPAVAAGVKIVLLSNKPQNFLQGKDYVAIVSNDNYQMGKRSADALAAAIGRKGKIAVIYYDAQYYVTNQYDRAFKATIESDYPNIKIIAQQGFSDPARTQDVTQALLLRHPDLDGIYVTWSEPAEGVLAALRAADNKSTKIVTTGLSELLGLDMVKGGNVAALTADEAYEIGRAMATVAGYGLIGKPAPAFIVAPAITVTKSSVADGWQRSLHRTLPRSLLKATK
jgi:ribose transport system substrate-binding protein